jgi:hypothetical protein
MQLLGKLIVSIVFFLLLANILLGNVTQLNVNITVDLTQVFYKD